jgi:hypothetical protein
VFEEGHLKSCCRLSESRLIFDELTARPGIDFVVVYRKKLHCSSTKRDSEPENDTSAFFLADVDTTTCPGHFSLDKQAIRWHYESIHKPSGVSPARRAQRFSASQQFQPGPERR